jgi:chemotaxis protein histidine kinase CheA
MAENLSSETIEKVKDIISLNYENQGIFYLNAFWSEGADAQAEQVFSLYQSFCKEDPRKEAGNELNPVQAFHLLQGRNETLTALELKAQLRKADIDNNGDMGLVEYLVMIHDRSVAKLISNPQGGDADSTEIDACQKQLEELNAKFDALNVQLEAQKKAEAEARQKAKDSKAAAESARVAEEDAVAQKIVVKAAEDEVRKVEEEAKAVDAALKAEEDAFHGECARLEALTTDTTVGIVKRNMAVQQLATLKGSDPLPLKKAKITQEAAVRRVARARKAAEAETEIAEQKAAAATDSRKAAEQAAVDAEEARVAAEVATEQVKKSIEQILADTAAAEERLQKLKSMGGVQHGKVFWMERALQEKKKYLPQRFQ